MTIIARTLALIKSDPLMLLGGDARVDEYFPKAGHAWRERVLTTDATSVTTPDKRRRFRRSGSSRARIRPDADFSAIKLLCLLDLVTGMIVQVTMTCMDVHEMGQQAGLHAGREELSARSRPSNA